MLLLPSGGQEKQWTIPWISFMNFPAINKDFPLPNQGSIFGQCLINGSFQYFDLLQLHVDLLTHLRENRAQKRFPGGYPKMLELKVRENIGDPTFNPTSRTSKSTIATLQEIETYRNFKLQNPTQIGNLLVDLFRESNFTLKTPSASARSTQWRCWAACLPPRPWGLERSYGDRSSRSLCPSWTSSWRWTWAAKPGWKQQRLPLLKGV